MPRNPARHPAGGSSGSRSASPCSARATTAPGLQSGIPSRPDASPRWRLPADPVPARSNSARSAPPCGSSPPASPRTMPPRTGPGRSLPVDPRAGNGRSASTPPWPRSVARTAPARSLPPGTRPASAVRTAGNDSPRPGARSPPAVSVRADHRPADAGARPPRRPPTGPLRTRGSLTAGGPGSGPVCPSGSASRPCDRAAHPSACRTDDAGCASVALPLAWPAHRSTVVSRCCCCRGPTAVAMPALALATTATASSTPHGGPATGRFRLATARFRPPIAPDARASPPHVARCWLAPPSSR